VARKVLIAVSGTGGHVYPGIALAEELRARRADLRVLFAAARGKPSSGWIADAGFPVAEVPLRGFSRRPGLSWLVFPFALIAGCVAAFSLLVSEGPDLVVGTGGYVSGPFVAFASLLRIPTVVLEQNSIPGVTTRLASLVAREVHVAFPETVTRLPRRGRAVVSGNPVRLGIERGDGAAFRAEHGVAPDAPLVVVVGGSQGAKALTDATIAASRRLATDGRAAIVLQAGARGAEAARAGAADLGAPGGLRVVPFLGNMGDAYAAADLVVARAGATTLAELAASGTPAILVPYPWAAEDHQRVNARRVAAAGAAIVIDPDDLTSERLADEIERLLGDETARRAMAEAAGRIEGRDGRARVADACERILG
jgi:UDP-N-acetylglucosamine--N-acetylmuramyl-(pentapeptide) pyrophosphoryl-undecaprenol N-acetylglucosamine transferase